MILVHLSRHSSAKDTLSLDLMFDRVNEMGHSLVEMP